MAYRLSVRISEGSSTGSDARLAAREVERAEPDGELVSRASEFAAYWPRAAAAGIGKAAEAIHNAVAGEDRIIAGMAQTPAAALAGVRIKAQVCQALAVDGCHNTVYALAIAP